MRSKVIGSDTMPPPDRLGHHQNLAIARASGAGSSIPSVPRRPSVSARARPQPLTSSASRSPSLPTTLPRRSASSCCTKTLPDNPYNGHTLRDVIPCPSAGAPPTTCEAPANSRHGEHRDFAEDVVRIAVTFAQNEPGRGLVLEALRSAAIARALRQGELRSRSAGLVEWI